MKDFKHFEELWVEGETLQAQSEPNTKNEICDEIIRLVIDYKNLSRDKLTKELFHTFATKKMGEIIFKVCKLCLIDNINSFEALFNEVKYFEVERLVEKYKS